MAEYFNGEIPESTPDFVFSNIQELLIDLPGNPSNRNYAYWLNEHFLGLENQSRDLVIIAPNYREEVMELFDYHASRIAEQDIWSISNKLERIAKSLGNAATVSEQA